MSSSRKITLSGIGIVLALAAFIVAAWVGTRPVQSSLADGDRILRPGVIHKFINDKTVPWRIHVIEIDLSQPDLHLETARATDRYRGRETISSIVSRKSDQSRYVVAAINGDYFNLETGESQNNHILGGDFVRAFTSPGFHPEYVDIPNSQLAITWDKHPSIDQFVFQGSVGWADGKWNTLSGVNIVPRRGGLSLFNSWTETSGAIGDESIGSVPLAIVRTANDTIVCVGQSQVQYRSDVPIPLNGFVLAGFKQWRPALDTSYAAGDTVRFVLRMHPAIGKIRELVGGWPRIVRNGKSIFESPDFPENVEAAVFSKRHPRTAIGFSADSARLFFVTVDGRQESSVGMSLPELARFMISQGIAEGLNLDGGGSTTMVVNGEIVNSPSDPTGERPVGNCILLVAQNSSPFDPTK